MDLAFEGDQQRPIGPMVPARQLVSAAAPKFLRRCMNVAVLGCRFVSAARSVTPGRKFCGECGALLDQVLAERLTQRLIARLATIRLAHAG